MNERENKSFMLYNAADISKIMRTFPFLKKDDIESIIPVLYPVVEVDIEYEERSFENFDIIPRLVLRFIDSGITSLSTIAVLMDLSVSYINRIVTQLVADNQLLFENEKPVVSELGKLSLSDENGILVKDHIGEQTFEMDGLSGNLIKIKDLVNERSLTEAEDKNFWVHIDAIDGIEFNTEDNQLLINSSEFIRQNRNVLNTNIKKIRDVEFNSLRYCRCFLFKLRDGSIFLFHKNTKFESVITTRNKTAQKYIRKPETTVLTPEGEERIDQAIQRSRMAGYAQGNNDEGYIYTKEETKGEIDSFCSFSDYEFDYNPDNSHYIITINKNSFGKYSKEINGLLKEYADKDIVITTSLMFCGSVVEFVLKDELVKQTAEKYAHCLDLYGERISASIENEFAEEKRSSIFERIAKVLEKYAPEEEL